MNVKITFKCDKVSNDTFNMSYNNGMITKVEDKTFTVDLTDNTLSFSFGGTTSNRNSHCIDVIATCYIRPLEYNGYEEYSVYPIVQNRPFKKDGTTNNKLFLSQKAITHGVGDSEECIIYIEINERLNNNTLIDNFESYNVRNTRLVYGSYSLEALATLINGEEFSQTFTYLFQNPADFVEYQLSLPFDIRNLRYYSSVDAIEKIDNTLIGRMSYNLNSQLFEKQKSNIYLGSIKCERQYNDFRDYSPYSSVYLFIPYYGFVNLDPSSVMGKTIRVYGIFNINEGNVTMIISADNKLIQVVDGKLAISFTMGSSSLIQSIMSMVNGIAGGAIAGGKIGGTAGLVLGGTIGALSQAQTSYEKGTLSSSATSFNNCQNLYLYIETTKGEYPNNFASIYGKPLHTVTSLSNLTGFTKVKDMHLENFDTATSVSYTHLTLPTKA